MGTFTFWALVAAGATIGALVFVAILLAVARTLVSSRVRLEPIVDAATPKWFDDIDERQAP
ncbi:MAG: hypothetical protein LBM94_00455 [Propionibacteriaceae bacterium]|nr:hypothetical protein [Propionibacteriaceae bacterium]